jgi:hypothetical protein
MRAWEKTVSMSREVLSALAEGLAIGAAVRVFGHSDSTITRWRDRAAQQAQRKRHESHVLRPPAPANGPNSPALRPTPG